MRNKRKLKAELNTEQPPLKKIKREPDASESSKNTNEPLTNSYRASKRIINKIPSMLINKKFDDLERYLCEISETEISAIFKDNCYSIFFAAYSIQKYSDEFKFIIKHVPQATLSDMIQQQDFKIFKSFLSTEKKVERLKLDTIEEREYRKFKLEFVINLIGENEIRNIIEQEDVSDKLKQDFESVCVKCRQGNKSTIN